MWCRGHNGETFLWTNNFDGITEDKQHRDDNKHDMYTIKKYNVELNKLVSTNNYMRVNNNNNNNKQSDGRCFDHLKQEFTYSCFWDIYLKNLTDRYPLSEFSFKQVSIWS